MQCPVVVIGAGQAGLAASHHLTARAIDHVVLERGRVAHSWRTERWDSLTLLTPNWMTRLPGWCYDGPDPDGFMPAAQVAELIAGYARRDAAPVRTHTHVTAAHAEGDGHRVDTDRGRWHCRALVLASGAFGQPLVPRLAAALPPGVVQLHAQHYRNPARLSDGGVLVVGASASGVQLAREIARSGRTVWLATGEHVRLPRSYRGRDIHRWMHAMQLLGDRIEDQDEIERARRLPSPQLAGGDDRRSIDLPALRADGVEIVGRLVGARDTTLHFSGALRNACALADLKMNRLLDAIDAFAAREGLDGRIGAIERFAPSLPPQPPRLALTAGIDVKTVLWATGHRPDLSWLQQPVFGADGRLQHDRGIVAGASGLYVLGLPFMRRRSSSFIHGSVDDAAEIAGCVSAFMTARRSAAAAACGTASPHRSSIRRPGSHPAARTGA